MRSNENVSQKGENVFQWCQFILKIKKKPKSDFFKANYG